MARLCTRFGSFAFASLVAISSVACGDDASVDFAPRQVVVGEFEGEIRDGVMTIRSFALEPGLDEDSVQQQGLSVITEDKSAGRGRSSTADSFEFVVEAGAVLQTETLGRVPNGCGAGANSINFAITARSFQRNGLSSAYAHITEIKDGTGALAPQFALCNSDDPSINVFNDVGIRVPVTTEFGLIRYGNLRPDASESDTPILTVGADPSAATMVWKFRDGNFSFRGRLLGLKCGADLCKPGVAMGEGLNVPTTSIDLWEAVGVTSPTVNTVVEGDGIVYIGGDFSIVAPRTGRSASFDLTKPADADVPLRPYAGFEADVRTIVADASGGYYVGGVTTMRASLQTNASAVWHVLANGRIDPAFIPVVFGPDTGVVNGLILSGTTLFMGGSFATVSGQPRVNGAAVDALTGTLLSFNPNFGGGSVNSMTIDGARVFFGGAFTSAGGIARSRFAAYSTTTPFALNPLVLGVTNGTITAMAVGAAGSLYTGGTFTAPVERLALWNTTTPTATRITTFTATSSSPVRALAFKGGAPPVLAVGAGGAGGAFNITSPPALSQSRTGAALLNANTGALLGFNAAINGPVNALVFDGNNLAVGGAFAIAQSSGGSNIAMYNVINPNNVVGTLFAAVAPAPVLSLAINAQRVLFVGGQGPHMAGRRRNGLAALSLVTGMPTSFNPNVSGGAVNGVAVAPNGDVYFVGNFDFVNDIVPRQRAAAVNAAGVVTAFAPSLDAAGFAIVLSGTDAVIGGAFTARLSRFQQSSGAPTTALPTFNREVRALATRGQDLYVGGEFTTPGSRLVRIDLSGVGPILDFGANGAVNSIATNARDVFATGAFSAIGGAAASRLASIDRRTGVLRWAGTLAAEGTAIATAGNHVYVASNTVRTFSARTGVGDTTFDASIPFPAAFTGRVPALAVVAEKVVVGGTFNTATFNTGARIDTNGISTPAARLVRSSLVVVNAN